MKTPIAKKKTLILATPLIGILLIIGSIFATKTLIKTKSATQPTPPPVPKEITQLIDTVSKQQPIPKDEIPTVATITNLSKLPDQPFFAKARNGDKLLIYKVAQKAILYRPTTQQIIQVSPLDILSPDATDSAQASDSAQPNSISPVLKIKF